MPKLPRTGGKASTSERAKKPAAKRAASAPREGTSTPSKRTTRAVSFAGLLMSSTLLYTNGDTTVAVIGYVLSAVSLIGVWLAGE